MRSNGRSFGALAAVCALLLGFFAAGCTPENGKDGNPGSAETVPLTEADTPGAAPGGTGQTGTTREDGTPEAPGTDRGDGVLTADPDAGVYTPYY